LAQTQRTSIPGPGSCWDWRFTTANFSQVKRPNIIRRGMQAGRRGKTARMAEEPFFSAMNADGRWFTTFTRRTESDDSHLLCTSSEAVPFSTLERTFMESGLLGRCAAKHNRFCSSRFCRLRFFSLRRNKAPRDSIDHSSVCDDQPWYRSFASLHSLSRIGAYGCDHEHAGNSCGCPFFRMGEARKDLSKLANGFSGLTSKLRTPLVCFPLRLQLFARERILPECRFWLPASRAWGKSQREALFHFFLFVSLRRRGGLTDFLHKRLKYNGLCLTRHYFEKIRFGHKGAPC
jgi:hypothetical protein